jgi:tyrosine-protein phosphatase SIW14
MSIHVTSSTGAKDIRMRNLLTALSALSLALVFCGPARTEVIEPSPTKPAKHVYKEQKGDLPNFHQVHNYLYRGGEPTAEGLKKLKDMGIKTIIDLRGSEAQVAAEADLAKAMGMRSINLPMSSKAPTKHQVDTFLKEVSKAEKAGDKAPVFVHCAHGSDRTGCLIGLWRVTHDNYDYDQAYKEMRKYYFGPKFTNLSGTVEKYARASQAAQSKN